jgi:hypothetical protein
VHLIEGKREGGRGGGFIAGELKEVHITARDLKAAGFTISELKGAGCTACLLKDDFDSAGLLGAGFSRAEFINCGHRDFREEAERQRVAQALEADRAERERRRLEEHMARAKTAFEEMCPHCEGYGTVPSIIYQKCTFVHNIRGRDQCRFCWATGRRDGHYDSMLGLGEGRWVRHLYPQLMNKHHFSSNPLEMYYNLYDRNHHYDRDD